MTDRERTVEAHLVAGVLSMGGWAIKIAPTAVGLPDRLVLLPGGKAHLVELKAPRGRLARAQRVVHRRLADMGHPVVVLASVEQVDKWVRDVRFPRDTGVGPLVKQEIQAPEE